MRLGEEQPNDGDQVSDQSTSRIGYSLNRRVIMKAAAGVAAIAAAGGIGVSAGSRTIAQSESVTRAESWQPDQFSAASVGESGDWESFAAAYPFYALGVSWNSDVGLWPVVEVQLSVDGSSWSDTYQMVADNDSGRDTVDNRIFAPLVHSDGGQYVRYRTADIDGVPGYVDGLEFVYIDATDGPWSNDLPAEGQPTGFTAAADDTRTPPQIVTREQWGANEGYRFDTFGEVWPPEYETVHHVIIHHTDTPNSQDPVVAIRSIYYYHSVTQGWGDIGYNYLVGRDGRIYQGRFGGQNVIGGHAYQYAVGSSGIGTIGDFQRTDVTSSALAALVAITAWVARDLNPLGREDFLQAPNLPVISSHRDVNATTCPGDFLYNDLPEIRRLVAGALDELDTRFAGGIIPGDRVRVQTDNGGDLNVRSGAGSGNRVTGTLRNRSYAMVVDGPVETNSGNWYLVDQDATGTSGWATASFLIVAPIPPPPFDADDYAFGLNIFAQQEVNIRSAPTTSASRVATVPRGRLGFILDGPRTANGYEWYQVRLEGNVEGWAVKRFIAPVAFNDSPNGRFNVGDIVAATEPLNVRSRPGVAQTVIARVPTGGRVQITQEPVAVNNYVWYGMFNDAAGGGWVVESSLRAVGTAPSPSGKFTIGDSARVTSTLNLRSSSTTSSSVVATMPAGTTGEIVGGPSSGAGYTWWQFRTAAYGTGWAAQDWLTETSAPAPAPSPGTPAPSGRFESGDAVRVTASLNLRSGPSTSNGVITILSSGTTGTVVSGPRSGSGYTWWQIRTSGGTGWVAQDWLAASSTSGNPGTPSPAPAPGGRYDAGDTVRVTASLNLRSGPSTNNGVITVLSSGTTGTVVSGPRSGSGYTWWQIRTSGGTGWVAQDWLAASGSTGTPAPSTFEVGEAVRVTESLNMRSAAGTGNSVIATLPAGTTGTITDGPSTVTGYTWWELRTSNRTGWVAQNWLA